MQNIPNINNTIPNEMLHDALHDEFFELNNACCTTCGRKITNCKCGSTATTTTATKAANV